MSVLIALILVVSPVLTSENSINAETNQTKNSNVKEVEIDKGIGNVIYGNLDKNDNGELYIVDQKKLSNSLDTLDQELTVEEVKTYVNNYNATIKEENGKKAKEDLLAYNEEVKKILKKIINLALIHLVQLQQ